MAIITLRYPAKCAECGAVLQSGAKAKYYATGIYGLDCHSKKAVSTDDMILADKPPQPEKKPRNVTS